MNTNHLVWKQQPGHYEVYYISATDPVTGIGIWIRYTLTAPTSQTQQKASCALWLMLMDPASKMPPYAVKQSYSVDSLKAASDPFMLELGDGQLTDGTARGAIGQEISWDLSWQPKLNAYSHVHPFIERLGISKTTLKLPHPAVAISGSVKFKGRTLKLVDVPAGQAHLWGSKHSPNWCWLHCNDLSDDTGKPASTDTFIDAVAVYLDRFGKPRGPVTALVARLAGEDFISNSPLAVATNRTRFNLSGCELTARTRNRKLNLKVKISPLQTVGVTYSDPDSTPIYCYNSEVADMELQLWERRAGTTGWIKRQRLISNGRAHYEYGTRQRVADLKLVI